MPLPNYPYAGKDTLTKADILETLQHWITVMQLKPGEKISDTEIAEYFNVSRTPVREVLKMLEQQKLIFTYPGRATIVADLALDDIESYYLPMQTLQCLAVRLAVEKADAADVEELERLNAVFGEVTERRNDAESILMADKNFHEKILEIAGNEYMFFRDNTMGTSYNDHKLMIESFRIKDPFGAELAMKNNWNYSMLAVKAVNDKGSIA